MRVAVPADDERGLDSAVSPHFGRCPCFVLVDLEREEVKPVRTIPNPHYGSHQPGQVPAFIHSKGVEVIVTGGMGRRAIAFFEQCGLLAQAGGALARRARHRRRGQ